MIRIVICMSSPEKAQSLFESAMETLKKLNVKCELSYSTNYGKVLDNLQASINYYDILILDFHDTSCLNLAKTIRSRNFVASIIFVTNIEASLHNSLKFRPTAFITAFDDTQQLSDALRHSCSEQLRSHPYFTVKNKDMLMRIHYDDITYFESRQRVAVMHTVKQTIEFYAKLADVLVLLPQDEFVRCHQSYIVNMNRVRQLDKVNRCFHMLSGTEVEISKSHYPQIVTQYDEFTNRH